MTYKGITSNYLRLIQGKEQGVWVPVALVVLNVLSLIYRFIICLRTIFYRLGIPPRKKLPVKVISVGNITVGGTGKTPLVRYLAQFYISRGKNPAILLRGYKSEFSGDVGVVSNGKEILMDPDEAGEEAVMLARQLPEVPVLIGGDRYRTGMYAIEELDVDIVILDDGFQFLRLRRDLDLVAIDAVTPFGYDYLLPRGLLREPVRALRRADVIIITKVEHLPQKPLEKLRQRLIAIAPDALIVEAKHRPVFLRDFTGREEKELELNKDRVLAFSGIADPQSFESSLQNMGADIVLRLRFPDHHHYSEEEILHIFSEAFTRQAELIITTEKDVMGLPPHLQELIAGQKMTLWVLGIEVEISSGEERFEDLLANMA